MLVGSVDWNRQPFAVHMIIGLADAVAVFPFALDELHVVEKDKHIDPVNHLEIADPWQVVGLQYGAGLHVSIFSPLR
jgi:hypothetical protein